MKNKLKLSTEQSEKERLHAKQIAGLRPAKKGEIRNPHGRPKKEICIPDILREIGTAKINVNGRMVTKRQLMLEQVYAHAIKGEQWAVQFIADRTEGKVVEKTQVENVSPREVVFREVRVGGIMAEVPATIRTITREPKP